MTTALPSQLRHFQTLGDLERARLPVRLQWPDLTGRLVEVVGGPLSLALPWLADMTRQVQAAGDTAVWLHTLESTPFPPDLVACGIALDRLPMVRLPDLQAQLRAADVLLRSGAFGLCALDATAMNPRQLTPRQVDNALGRLLGLCQKHTSALVFLTPAPPTTADTGDSGGFLQSSLISLRLSIQRDRHDLRRGQLVVKKDKRRGPVSLPLIVELPAGVGQPDSHDQPDPRDLPQVPQHIRTQRPISGAKPR